MSSDHPRLTAAVALLVWLAASSQSVWAQAALRRYDIPAEDLTSTLDRIAKAADTSLLYDPILVSALKAPALHLTGSPEQAFAAALDGSGLAAKRMGPGAYALVRLPLTEKPAPAPQTITTVPELLIVGRRTVNADLPRRANDVQPYRVLGADDIAGIEGGSTAELLRDLSPSNLTQVLDIQFPIYDGGIINSSIDLRQLGPEQTLVLVDGRRLPSSPDLAGFNQSDVAGIPQAAIERIETLSGTSGGLYGPGATGGVVNIVLKHDFASPWIEVQDGLNRQGSGQESRVDGGFSYNSPDGGTRFSLLADYGSDAGLTYGEQDFGGRGLPAFPQQPYGVDPRYSSNINVMSVNGKPLVLIPSLGGESLGSSITNLAPNSGGAGGNEAALLLAGAGHFDDQLSDDGAGKDASVLAASKTGAVIADLRQDVGGRLELFGDLLFYSELGIATGPEVTPTEFTLAPGALGNPFTSAIMVTAPAPGLKSDYITVDQTLRVTGGAIVHLTAGWSADFDATWEQSSYHARQPANLLTLQSANVFSPGSGLSTALAALGLPEWIGARLDDQMGDYSLRLAGPLVVLPGGPTTLSLALERRDETNPGEVADADSEPVQDFGRHSLSVTSASGELRAPLISSTSRMVPLRGLELQLAGRVDRDDILQPDEDDTYPGDAKADLQAHYTTLAFTVGAKATPLAGLTLRASLATGNLPPTPDDILPTIDQEALRVRDPERPATAKADRKLEIKVVSDGVPSLQPEQAQTVSGGFIVAPPQVPGLRFSIDYTQIALSNQITDFASDDLDYFVKHEAAFPGHVIRAPLTAADAALGDTAGVITEIYATDLNTGRTTVGAMDFDLSYDHVFSFGRIHLFASTSWEPRFQTRTDPFSASSQLAGTFGGPVEWKGDSGVQWRLRGLSASLTGHFIDSYPITSPENSAAENQELIAVVGGPSVPAQVYLDATFTYQFTAAGRHPVAVRFAVNNLLDRIPPYDPTYGLGYSLYGDPSGRRFVMSFSAAF